jgi:acetate kinase
MDSGLLVVNAGSSSVKFSLYEHSAPRELRPYTRGQVTGIGTRPRLVARDAGGGTLADLTFAPAEVPDVPNAMLRAGAWLREMRGGTVPVAVGHRVVHGGPAHATPAIVDDTLLSALEELVSLAPLHQPHNLAAIHAIRDRYPDTVQVACFDTAFHRGHPDLADTYALPEALHREGVRRYGFHGLSYEFIARALRRIAPEIVRGKVVVGHLGSGASMCAMRDGRSVDSTMGFTALDGLPMGTRCGQLDPGVVLHLLRDGRHDFGKVERLLYEQSGLRGLSGISNDVRDLLGSSDPRARFALDYFVYQVGRAIGTLAAAMQGIDALVLTGGISENSFAMRARICAAAAWLGLQIDDAANRNGGPRLSTTASRVSAWVIPTDEERMIAEHTLDAWLTHRARGAVAMGQRSDGGDAIR